MFVETKGEGEVQAPATAELWQLVLSQAVKVLQQYGWCQGHLHKLSGEFCTVGAIGSALDVAPIGQRGITFDICRCRVIAHIRRSMPLLQSIEDWNDLYCSSRDEAIALLQQVVEGA